MVHHPTHKRPPSVSILGQPNPAHIPTSHLLDIHPNIIHPSTPRSPQLSPSYRRFLTFGSSHNLYTKHERSCSVFAPSDFRGFTQTVRTNITSEEALYYVYSSPLILHCHFRIPRIRYTQFRQIKT